MVHSDIGSHNFLVQDDGNLVLADFGGFAIDASPARVAYSARYTRPVSLKGDTKTEVIDDLFALGTVIYEITVGHRLYPENSSREVDKLLRKAEFPDIDAIKPMPSNVKRVIQKCWASAYCGAGELLRDLDTEMDARFSFIPRPQ